MNSFNNEIILLNLAMELENDPAFMSHVLARYCQIEGLDKDALADELGIPLFLLARLALCKRPDADSPNFINEISEIADYIPMDELRLVSIIREVESLAVLNNRADNHETEEFALNNPFSAGILAAARDRIEDDNADEIIKDEDE
ncbi:MAG: hypothetical protein LUM44_09465 [Pyrinomonadaceae bacterium]|nr:hypothetical protein [Pyrinomonadaceae bacterium]